jgi:hypothetical protein
LMSMLMAICGWMRAIKTGVCQVGHE